jgi:hypothetical protein
VWSFRCVDATKEIHCENSRNRNVRQNQEKHQERSARGVGDGDEQLAGAFELDRETENAQRAQRAKRGEDGADALRLLEHKLEHGDHGESEVEQVDEGLEVERAEGEDAEKRLCDKEDAANEVDPVADLDHDRRQVVGENGERDDVECGDEDGEELHSSGVDDVFVDPHARVSEEAPPRFEEEGVGQVCRVHAVEQRLEEALVGIRHVPFRGDVVFDGKNGDEEVHDAKAAKQDDRDRVQNRRRARSKLHLLDLFRGQRRRDDEDL